MSTWLELKTNILLKNLFCLKKQPSFNKIHFSQGGFVYIKLIKNDLSNSLKQALFSMKSLTFKVNCSQQHSGNSGCVILEVLDHVETICFFPKGKDFNFSLNQANNLL